MEETPTKYNIPANLSPLPGNLSATELKAYLQELSAFLRKGPRLSNLQDTTTISRSSIGKNITLQHLRRLLHLSELLPKEVFATYLLMDGRNYFEFLHIFDEVYKGYYEEMTANSCRASINTIRVIIFVMAITIVLSSL